MTQDPAMNAVCEVAGEIIVRAALKRWEERSPTTFKRKALHWQVRNALADAVAHIVEVADTARLAAPVEERTLVFFEQVRLEAIKVMDRELERIEAWIALRGRAGSTLH